jgi:hypothetical protein
MRQVLFSLPVSLAAGSMSILPQRAFWQAVLEVEERVLFFTAASQPHGLEDHPVIGCPELFRVSGAHLFKVFPCPQFARTEQD